MISRFRGSFAALALMVMMGPVPPTLAQQGAPVRIPGPAMLADARAAFERLDEGTRMAIQEALIWTGDYRGAIDGTFGPRTFDAIASHQRRERLPANGVLLAEDIEELLAIGAAERDVVGFALVDDSRTGVRIGIPLALMERRADPPHGGARWQTPDERVTLDTRIFAPGEAELPGLFERLTGPGSGRQVTYSLLRENFLVVSGETAGGKFYIRHDLGEAGIRGFTLGYDKALADDLDRLALAVAGSFEPFPRGAVRESSHTVQLAEPSSGPFATGLIIARGTILTSLAADSCRALRLSDRPITGRQRSGGALLLTAVLDREPPPVFAQAAAIDPRAVALAHAGTPDAPRLMAVPGEVREGSISASLQPGATGAPVFARNGMLIGVVAGFPAETRQVAGVVPPADYTLVMARDFAEVVPAGGGGSGASLTAGALAAAHGGAVVPLICDD
jgi:peptidoglycan hydrolase-like protein with peptidoglycan-binding domain